MRISTIGQFGENLWNFYLWEIILVKNSLRSFINGKMVQNFCSRKNSFDLSFPGIFISQKFVGNSQIRKNFYKILSSKKILSNEYFLQIIL